jgi:acyl transferase domain-containing protein
MSREAAARRQAMTVPDRAEIEAALKRFISEELLEEPFAGEDPLAAGEVDSLGIEQLVEYVFDVWAVELEDEEIVEENFESVSALAALVASRS